MSEPFDRDHIIAHTTEEGGDWIKGYAPNWSTAVHRDGRVFDRVIERRLGRLLRNTIGADELAHIENVVSGRWKPTL